MTEGYAGRVEEGNRRGRTKIFFSDKGIFPSLEITRSGTRSRRNHRSGMVEGNAREGENAEECLLVGRKRGGEGGN